MRLKLRFRYSLMEPLCSFIPQKILMYLDRHWQLCYDDSDGWTFWMGAAYIKYCRQTKGNYDS